MIGHHLHKVIPQATETRYCIAGQTDLKVDEMKRQIFGNAQATNPKPFNLSKSNFKLKPAKNNDFDKSLILKLDEGSNSLSLKPIIDISLISLKGQQPLKHIPVKLVKKLTTAATITSVLT